ncbi:hypothetical protein Ciccas_009445 [Cichlidogyrus casuarinus]|uniref:Uncharacterized protein n=1 Tax=Cichlidogyrus casuarinus TaxID=1844966 RepID=A0ABD2PX17_9PLAT
MKAEELLQSEKICRIIQNYFPFSVDQFHECFCESPMHVDSPISLTSLYDLTENVWDGLHALVHKVDRVELALLQMIIRLSHGGFLVFSHSIGRLSMAATSVEACNQGFL